MKQACFAKLPIVGPGPMRVNARTIDLAACRGDLLRFASPLPLPLAAACPIMRSRSISKLTQPTVQPNHPSLSGGGFTAMTGSLDRRSFLRSAAATGAALGLGQPRQPHAAAPPRKRPRSPCSRSRSPNGRSTDALFAKEMDNLDFPLIAKRDYGIDGVEYVNVFFKDKAKDTAYLTDLKKRCDDNGVTSVLIMCDDEGDLGDPDEAKRTEAVENHYKWVEAAKFLGCHSIRVNARSNGTLRRATGTRRRRPAPAQRIRRQARHQRDRREPRRPVVQRRVARRRDEEGRPAELRHAPRLRQLPHRAPASVYDKYKGVSELMPYAKGVSAKSHVFDAAGNETEIDYTQDDEDRARRRLPRLVGIEWEGEHPQRARRRSAHQGPPGTSAGRTVLDSVADSSDRRTRKRIRPADRRSAVQPRSRSGPTACGFATPLGLPATSPSYPPLPIRHFQSVLSDRTLRPMGTSRCLRTRHTDPAHFLSTACTNIGSGVLATQVLALQRHA